MAISHAMEQSQTLTDFVTKLIHNVENSCLILLKMWPLWFFMCSIFTNILTVLDNFLGIIIIFYKKTKTLVMTVATLSPPISNVIWWLQYQVLYHLRQSTSALAGDLDPYPQVFQIQNAIPGSVWVTATRWLRAMSQKLMGSWVPVGPQVLRNTYGYSVYQIEIK